MDSADFSNILKIISPLSSNIKNNIEKFINKEKKNEIENFYSSIENKTVENTEQKEKNNKSISEKSDNIDKNKESNNIKKFDIKFILDKFYTIFNVILGLWAAYISWNINTKGNWSILLKLIFSIAAFLLAPLYLLLHFLFRYECLFINNNENNITDTSTNSNTKKYTSNSNSKSLPINNETKISQPITNTLPKIPNIPTMPAISNIKKNTLNTFNTNKPPNAYISNNINNTNLNIDFDNNNS